MITVFVEGPTDALFIDNLFPNIEMDKIEYSTKKNDRICNHIASLDKMREPYIFLFDTDMKDPDKKLKEKLLKYKNLKKENCFPVIIEIESWYRAGCSASVCKKYKIKSLPNTNSYCKEKMRTEFNTCQLKSIYQEIMMDFSVDDAILLNISFKNFYTKFLKVVNDL